jgi:phosphatidate phosphatase APP1
MPRESHILRRMLGESEALLDWAKYRFRRRRAPGHYHIQAYRGHGTAERLFLSGRVFEGLPIPAANAADATMRNLWHTVRRLGSDEVPAALVRGSVDGTSVTVLADDEGFFEVELPVTTHAGEDEAWRAVELELLDPSASQEPVRTVGLSVVPPEDARFGIISDIDDTVVRTEVANLLRMMRLVLLTNAHTRLPFPGVAAFYRALHEGTAGRFTNPVFYVSSSPWNFYDLLTEVFEVHQIPAGPLFLKDYGLARDLLLSRGHEEHKGAAIDHILETHPGLPFVLMGDSGQKDPEVYRDAVRRHPGRIHTIYIRDVTDPKRDAEVHAIAADTSAYGVEMVLVQDTLSAAQHAVDRGLIDAGALHDVREERA